MKNVNTWLHGNQVESKQLHNNL